jgi:secondary thiamine-phosphate synthase enzyme
MKSFEVVTKSRVQMIDITHQVASAVRESKIKEGIALVFVPHTTAGITINENADPDVTRDMIYGLNKLIPFEDGYHHGEGNSAAHIKSSLVGCSQSVIIEDGELVLGTWQSIYFCEFDGPRKRKCFVQVTG